MRKMKNIEIDLLLRVDFFALTKYGDREDYSIKQFTIDKEEIKIKYQIPKYYTRQKDGYEYIRLTDVDNNIESYRRYLEDLKSINKFWCCHLEQAIGLFQNKELKIFFSTDSGLCYDTKSHLSAIEEMYSIKSFEDWIENGSFNINTFFGKRIDDILKIQYVSNSNYIDIESEYIEKYQVRFDEFSRKLDELKTHIELFYKKNKKTDKGFTRRKRR